MENNDVLINAGYFWVSVYSSLTQRTTQKYLPGFRMESKTNPDLGVTYVFDAQSVRCFVNQGTMRGFLNESSYAWDKQYHYIDQSDNEWYCREFHNGGYLFEISLNGTPINYGKIVISDVPNMNVREFQDFESLKDAELAEGVNCLEFKVNNDVNWIGGGTVAATAPLFDCVKIDTSAVLWWDGGHKLPANNYSRK